jgi:hypothetical protein
MTQSTNNGGHQAGEVRFSLFDRTGPFTALTSLIRRHADNPDVQPELGRETATQVAIMVAEGLAPALLAAMAATTGEILNDWFGGNPPRSELLAGLDSTIAQPRWSPAPEAALHAARDMVVDYVAAPRPPDDEVILGRDAGEPIAGADVLNAGLMMCLELVRAGRRGQTQTKRKPIGE